MTLSRPLRQAQGRLCRTDRDSALVADLFQRVLSKSADRKKVNLDKSGRVANLTRMLTGDHQS